jgi:hypothetical protein
MYAFSLHSGWVSQNIDPTIELATGRAFATIKPLNSGPATALQAEQTMSKS